MTIFKALGYSGFFLFSVVFGLYETFPWDVVKGRIFEQVRQQAGIELEAVEFGPSWVTGVEAKKLRVKPSALSETWIELDRAGARVSLIPLLRKRVAGSVWGVAGKSEISGKVTSADEFIDLVVELDKVDFGEVKGLREWSGLPLEGKVSLDLDLHLDKKEAKNTIGKFELATFGLKTIPGGKAGPLPIPEIEVGDTTLSAPIKEGKLVLERSKLDGKDLQAKLDGSIQLGWPLAKTMVNVDAGLKPSEKVFQAEPLLKPLLGNFNRTKDEDGFYHVILAGPIKSIRPRPGTGKSGG